MVVLLADKQGSMMGRGFFARPADVAVVVDFIHPNQSWIELNLEGIEIPIPGH